LRVLLNGATGDSLIAGRTLNAVSDGTFVATHHDLRVLSGFLLF